MGKHTSKKEKAERKAAKAERVETEKIEKALELAELTKRVESLYTQSAKIYGNISAYERKKRASLLCGSSMREALETFFKQKAARERLLAQSGKGGSTLKVDGGALLQNTPGDDGDVLTKVNDATLQEIVSPGDVSSLPPLNPPKFHKQVGRAFFLTDQRKLENDLVEGIQKAEKMLPQMRVMQAQFEVKLKEETMQLHQLRRDFERLNEK